MTFADHFIGQSCLQRSIDQDTGEMVMVQEARIQGDTAHLVATMKRNQVSTAQCQAFWASFREELKRLKVTVIIGYVNAQMLDHYFTHYQMCDSGDRIQHPHLGELRVCVQRL